MDFNAPKDWEKDSDNRFIHDSGVRIQKMTYKGKDGWFIVPLEIEEAVVEFAPTAAGRDQAFAAFALRPVAKKPKKAKPAAAGKADAGPDPKGEEPEAAKEVEETKADDEAKDDEEEEGADKAEADEGDEE